MDLKVSRYPEFEGEFLPWMSFDPGFNGELLP